MKIIGYLLIVFFGIMMCMSYYKGHNDGVIFYGIVMIGLLIEYHLNRVIESIENKSD